MRYTIQGADCRLSVAVYNESATKTLVVLHGMRDHGGSFEWLGPLLADFRVIIPDLRGHGLSDQNGVYTLTHFTADLLQVFDAFQVEQGYLLGHSLGGHVAARFAALFGHRLIGLILVDGFGHRGSKRAGISSSLPCCKPLRCKRFSILVGHVK